MHIDISVDNNSKDTNRSQFLPLKLPNAKFLDIRSLHYFYIKWSHKCKELNVGCLNINLRRYIDINIDGDKWLEYVINNCDCSGIEYLNIDDSLFGLLESYECLTSDDYDDHDDEYDHADTRKGIDIIKKFGNKFMNGNLNHF